MTSQKRSPSNCHILGKVHDQTMLSIIIWVTLKKVTTDDGA